MRTICLLVGLLLVLAGCAGQTSRTPTEPSRQPPDALLIASVPFFPQAAYQCGPASLAMMLGWSGSSATLEELIAQVYAPGRKGSLQSSIVAAARRHSRLAYVIQGRQCLMQELSAGHPVLVLQNRGVAWLPRWHYAVVVGFDPAENQVVMHSGRQAQRRVGLRTFERTWRRAGDWGLVVLDPGELPACAEETAYLKAAAGLEQAGAGEAAVSAYRGATARWPENSAAHVALGNALYALGDQQGAVAAFGQAIHIDPHNGPALNNLAHILAEQGLLDEAEAIVRRAIEYGGAHRATFEQTLLEIRKRRSEP